MLGDEAAHPGIVDARRESHRLVHVAHGFRGFVAAGLGFSLGPSLDPRGPRRAGVVVERLRGAGTELTVYAARRRGPHHPLVEAALSAAPVPGS